MEKENVDVECSDALSQENKQTPLILLFVDKMYLNVPEICIYVDRCD